MKQRSVFFSLLGAALVVAALAFMVEPSTAVVAVHLPDMGMNELAMLGMAGIMSPRQARVIDPVLSNHARGYGNPDVERAGRVLFPRAPIDQRGAKIVKFGKEAFRLYNTERAPGAAKKRVSVGYSSDTVSLNQHALAGQVTFEALEDANAVPGIDLGRRALNVPMEIIRREEEYRAAQIAQNAANYATDNKDTLSGTDQWTDAGSKPGEQMDDAHMVIRSRIGRRGNVLVLGPNVYNAARRNAKVIAQVFAGSANKPEMVTRDQLAAYFGVKKIAVGDDIYLPATASDDDAFSDVWGNVAILAYVPSVDGEGDIEVPSFGYTYYLKGHPLVEAPWQDRDHDVWVYPTKDEYQPVLTGMHAGFLFTDVIPSA